MPKLTYLTAALAERYTWIRMAKPLSLYEVPIFHALKENSDLQHQPILQIKIIIIMKFNISKILFYD